MAFERQWPAVPPSPFTANGGSYGQVQVADASGFKVGSTAVVSATNKSNITVKIYRVLSETTMVVGLPDGSYKNPKHADLSEYQVSNSAFIYADLQSIPNSPPNDRDDAVYDHEPTVAWRNVLVDQLGQYYTSENPLPITFDNSGPASSVTLKDDAGDELKINDDGSINVNLVTAPTDNKIKNKYGEAASVPAGIETTIVQYVVPLNFNSAILQRVSVSGENIARYKVLINGVVIDTRRTYFGTNLNEYFEFSMGSGDGTTLRPGDTVTIKVLHSRPFAANFESRIQVLEIV